MLLSDTLAQLHGPVLGMCLQKPLSYLTQSARARHQTEAAVGEVECVCLCAHLSSVLMKI